MAAKDQPVIVIKKIKKADHGHHGGAWKIAYADFVTAMMAFFLLMWLINMTTDEQKKGLAEYFAPESASTQSSGSGGVLGGSSLDDAGSLMSGYSPKNLDPTAPAPRRGAAGSADPRRSGAGAEGDHPAGALADQTSPADIETYRSAAVSIRQALKSMPELTPFQDNVLVEVTEDGLKILIADLDGRPMFRKGSKQPLEHTRALVAAIAPHLQKLGAPVEITGHTAAGALYRDSTYGPWELSADRANAIRSVLAGSGLPDGLIKSVVGLAASEPYFIDDPFMAANERVQMMVVLPPPPMPMEWKL